MVGLISHSLAVKTVTKTLYSIDDGMVVGVEHLESYISSIYSISDPVAHVGKKISKN